VRARRPFRILVIAPLRFPISQPHAGGLESAVWTEVEALRRRGHAVTLAAVRGSDFVEPGSVFELPALQWPDGGVQTDEYYPPSLEQLSVPALARVLDAVARRPERYDAVSNHCLHPLPLRRAPTLGVPMVTTLHTPVDVEFVKAHRAAAGKGSRFLSVSEHTRGEWSIAGVASDLLPHGIDPLAWPAGPGGEGLVWFGRIVPEKAPHLAVDVAKRLGMRLTIAGRVGDRAYAERTLFPLLGDRVTHVGVLDPKRLAALVGASAAAVATPAWAEPFGLVAPEALMCGTPVVSFAVGGVPEIATRSVGMEVVPPGDTAAMSESVRRLVTDTASDPALRRQIRSNARARFSLNARLDALESVFATMQSGESLVSDLNA
jgi:glycosyltransferase involved in cell wall biosynthesis